MGSSYLCELTKRDELSLRMVLALPNASIAGFASMIWSSKDPCKDSITRSQNMEAEGRWRQQQDADGQLTHFFMVSPKAATMAKY